MKDVAKWHQKQIEKRNKQYPMMEYFLTNKTLEEIDPKVRKQVENLHKWIDDQVKVITIK
tara:strand:- start:1793 stop:1972 length:180 start_codon:yes stop_codon:yes gene_type:complete